MPTNYLTKHVPRSVKEVLDVASQDRVLSIVKNSILNYVRAFMDTMGVNRAIAEELGSSTLQYITDLTLPTNLDPALRPTQLAVMSEQLTQKIPAIIVQETALPEWVSSGLGQKDSDSYLGADQVNQFAFIFKCQIQIAVVTNDQASTQDLSTLISLMFGPLQNLAGGSRIKSDDPKSNWVITLPLVLPAPTLTPVALEGDNIEKFWVGQLPLEVRYESKAAIRITQDTVKSVTGVVAPPQFNPPPEISLPATVLLNSEFQVGAQFMELRDKIVVDPKVNFGVSWENLDAANVKIKTLKLGAFDVLVLDGDGKLKARKTCQIVLA